MYYHTTLTVADGMRDVRRKVTFKSDAKTTHGIERALARAIVEQFGTDVFEVNERLMSRSRKDEWPTGSVRIDGNEVWRIAHDLMIG